MLRAVAAHKAKLWQQRSAFYRVRREASQLPGSLEADRLSFPLQRGNKGESEVEMLAVYLNMVHTAK